MLFSKNSVTSTVVPLLNETDTPNKSTPLYTLSDTLYNPTGVDATLSVVFPSQVIFILFLNSDKMLI